VRLGDLERREQRAVGRLVARIEGADRFGQMVCTDTVFT
jgi:hypothetical protein